MIRCAGLVGGAANARCTHPDHFPDARKMVGVRRGGPVEAPKTCRYHPSQIRPILRAFAPALAEVEAAARILLAAQAADVAGLYELVRRRCRFILVTDAGWPHGICGDCTKEHFARTATRVR